MLFGRKRREAEEARRREEAAEQREAQGVEEENLEEPVEEASLEEVAEEELPQEDVEDQDVEKEEELPQEDQPDQVEQPQEEVAEEEDSSQEPAEEKSPEPVKRSFFGALGARLNAAFGGYNEITEDLYEELEEILIISDMGMDTTETLIRELRRKVNLQGIRKAQDARDLLEEEMKNMVDLGERCRMSTDSPLIILMIGINGGGKTTTIGKLAYKYKQEGKSVLLVAADTFRAAAEEQLQIWAQRVQVPIITGTEGGDPASVLYDGISAAKSQGAEVIIVDTAGRLQNKKNLMAELAKMNRIIDSRFPEAARETLLVLDANTGKNAISQVEQFGQTALISGVVLTKLDGTAKGGIAITISQQFDLPIKFIGVGEQMKDLREFDPAFFIGGIFHE